MTGYSGTPLPKKLGIKPGTRLFVSGDPGNYGELVTPLPEGVRVMPKFDSDTDIAHFFVTRSARLREALSGALKKMKPEAVIWVSWPKKAAKLPTDVTEDTIREIALPMGLVDVKVCAVDETWSGLKLVIRKENRK